MTQAHNDYQTISTFIARERAMRVRVFANKPDIIRKAKLRDCDEAAAALKRLYADSLRTDPQQQMLFEAEQAAQEDAPPFQAEQKDPES